MRRDGSLPISPSYRSWRPIGENDYSRPMWLGGGMGKQLDPLSTMGTIKSCDASALPPLQASALLTDCGRGDYLTANQVIGGQLACFEDHLQKRLVRARCLRAMRREGLRRTSPSCPTCCARGSPLFILGYFPRQTTFGNCHRTYDSSIRRDSSAKRAKCWSGTHRSSRSQGRRRNGQSA